MISYPANPGHSESKCRTIRLGPCLVPLPPQAWHTPVPRHFSQADCSEFSDGYLRSDGRCSMCRGSGINVRRRSTARRTSSSAPQSSPPAASSKNIMIRSPKPPSCPLTPLSPSLAATLRVISSFFPAMSFERAVTTGNSPGSIGAGRNALGTDVCHIIGLSSASPFSTSLAALGTAWRRFAHGDNLVETLGAPSIGWLLGLHPC